MTANKKSKSESDRDLNTALKQSFPASDPPASNVADDKPVRPKDRRAPLFDKSLINRLADKLADRLKTKRR